MIPKVIHFCWLSGDPYPPLIAKCIESWKINLPDYQIILWDTKKIDVTSNVWLEQAYKCRKYAFAADYIRFYALYNYGGIYLDADVEVIKSFDDLLFLQQFIGEDASGDIEAAVMGAEKGARWVKECLDYYENRSFIKENGRFDMRPVPLLVYEVLTHYPDVEVFHFSYFSPKDYNIGKIAMTAETYCIHHFDGKWLSKGVKYKIKIMLHKLLYYLFSRRGHNRIVKYIRNL